LTAPPPSRPPTISGLASRRWTIGMSSIRVMAYRGGGALTARTAARPHPAGAAFRRRRSRFPSKVSSRRPRHKNQARQAAKPPAKGFAARHVYWLADRRGSRSWRRLSIEGLSRGFGAGGRRDSQDAMTADAVQRIQRRLRWFYFKGDR
jgi:hypothetical protein